MIYSLIQLPAPLYWCFILATLAGIMRVAYLLGSTPRPSPMRPFFRRVLVLLPFASFALQIESTTQGRATVLIVQW